MKGTSDHGDPGWIQPSHSSNHLITRWINILHMLQLMMFNPTPIGFSTKDIHQYTIMGMYLNRFGHPMAAQQCNSIILLILACVA